MTDRNANRPGYKKTKLGWIPEEWEVKTLKHIGQIYTGGTPSTTNTDYWDGDINWIIPSEVTQIEGPFLYSSERKITEKGLKNSSAKVVPENSVIVCTRATIGNCVINKIPTATNQGFKSLSPNENHDVKFIYYSIVKNKNNLLRLGAGSTFLEVSRKDFERIRLATPPLSEQKRIAEILSTWDRAIKQTRQLIDAKQRLKKGLMQQLLTGRMCFPGFGAPVEKAGELPEGWERKTLGEIGTFSKGANIQKSDLVDDGIPCIRYGEIYTVHDFILKEFKSYISPATAKSSKRIYKGDILFAGSGETREEIGKCFAYVDEYEAYAGGDVIIFRSKEVHPNYLGYLLNHPVIIKQKSALGQGYSIFHIYPNMLKKLIIHLPPRNEQEKIVHVFSTLDNEILRLVKLTKFLNLQKMGLLQKLLSGEVRV